MKYDPYCHAHTPLVNVAHEDGMLYGLSADDRNMIPS